MIAKSKETETTVRWKILVDSIKSKCASITKKAEISSRLEAMRIEDVRKDNDVDYAALVGSTKRINQLAPIARSKDNDYEAKVRFMTKAVTRTTRGLHAQQRILPQQSFQCLANALYMAMRELVTFPRNHPLATQTERQDHFGSH